MSYNSPALAPVAIRLRPDYGLHPLWWADGKRFGDIDPATLSLSQETRELLGHWARRYDAILDENDPSTSDFDTPEDAAAFRKDGTMLQERLQRELGASYTVLYDPNKI